MKALGQGDVSPLLERVHEAIAPHGGSIHTIMSFQANGGKPQSLWVATEVLGAKFNGFWIDRGSVTTEAAGIVSQVETFCSAMRVAP